MLSIIFISSFAFASLQGNLLKDPVAKLCKTAKYNAKCNPCKTGWTIHRFSDKNSNTVFGSYEHYSCATVGEFACGDSFFIESEKFKKFSCEEFIVKIQKKQNDCHNCLIEGISSDN